MSRVLKVYTPEEIEALPPRQKRYQKHREEERAQQKIWCEQNKDKKNANERERYHLRGGKEQHKLKPFRCSIEGRSYLKAYLRSYYKRKKIESMCLI